jgi:hypothetical protein
MAAAVTKYERATGARINYRKSKALPIGAWDSTETAIIIPYVQEAKILGISFQNTLAGSIAGTWTRFTNSIRGRAQEMYGRDLNLIQRIHVVYTFLLSRLWYVAQTLPIPRDHARQITMSVLSFILARRDIPGAHLHLASFQRRGRTRPPPCSRQMFHVFPYTYSSTVPQTRVSHGNMDCHMAGICSGVQSPK